MKKCCLCGCDIEDYGNNPAGAKYKDEEGNIIAPTFTPEDRCCDICNSVYVIPGRLHSLLEKKGEN